MKTEAAPQQLTLLPSSNVNPRFRIDRKTRQRGLRHVAEIRQMLAARTASSDNTVVSMPPRTNRAA